jgi:hypothetical protein
MLESKRRNVVPALASASDHYFLALHKDPNDPTKLRPIGIGTFLRRIAGAIVMAHFGSAFAKHLLPEGQLVVGISGSRAAALTLLSAVDLLQMSFDRYIIDTVFHRCFSLFHS